MAKSKPKIQKRLAKLVLAALLFTGEAQLAISPSVAEASEVTTTVTGCTYTETGPIFTPNGSMISANYNYAFIPADTNTTVLNLNGDWSFSTTIYGHHEAGSSDVSGYTVNLNGPKIDWNLCGAQAIGGGNATDNHVKVSTGTVEEIVAGAIAWAEGVEVSGNSVTVSGDDTVVGKVAGAIVYSEGYSYASDVLDNTVTIDGGQITGGVYGGSVEKDYVHYDNYYGDVTNNKVEINNGTFTFDSTLVAIAGGFTEIGDASNNNYVTINNGTFTFDSTRAMDPGATDIAGGFTKKGNASNNHVKIYNGTFRTSDTDTSLLAKSPIISGGTTCSGNANENNVTINNGTFISGAGIMGTRIIGGCSADGSANDNTVTINGGTFKTSTTYPAVVIYGGEGTKEANKNTVTINTSMVYVDIYGGRAIDSYQVKGTAANNTVNILKPHNAFEKLYGGDGDETTSTGNTLNLAAKDVTAGWVNYFQNMNFTLPSGIANNDTMLTVYHGSTNLTGVTFGMKNAENVNLNPGDVINVLVNENGLAGDFTDKNYELAFDVNVTDNLNLKGTQGGVLKKDGNTKLIYTVGKKDVNTINIGAVKWQKDATLFDGSDAGYNYANVRELGTKNFAVTYDKPEDVAANDSMTLLKANETLQKMAEQTKSTSYSCAPVSGVTIDASITGKLAASDGKVTFTAAENKASKLTFGDVEWKDSGALLTRPSNITFAGADVDTAKIKFTNVIYLDAEQQMTLVSDFGDSVGTVTGDKYMVGTAFEGEGEASLQGSDLVFRTKTAAGVSEQTHKAVMGVEATMALLASGSEYVANVLDGLGDASNAGKDGVSTAASIGGGHSRLETGSHVSANTWNAAVGVGATKETKKGTLQYGIFGEYGKASYTLHSDAGKSDGDAHYAGGGILAKWTNKHDVYAEASFRLGRVSDNANDLLRDAAGNAYGYDIHANYFGAHVGVGKVFNYKGGKSLDVYGKYFYTRRDGAEFDAVQHYNLDSVSSSVLRIGARYGSNDKKWNWYGGLAYEYEFDGESKGTVNGTEIRAASIKGSSVRAELGMRMNATKTNPWQTDISIYGYGGKHRGIGGNVSVAYTF